ncbi:MAG: 2-oxoacid:acceptor oxidoreductase subunit alpha [Armatimonadetes bacterium]|nr:2-oxoacid:acceptor oxidoreductase subunit alpha [Armatimonadota bacterium]
MLSGNEACALAAIDAGMRFYAGYPITPSSEIAEHLANWLPRMGGVFIAMEDEIASMGAIIGASLTGTKAMTATSGPGFSLMQENIGYASMAEVPVVVVNVMRGGPSTGLPTSPAQGDVMQARWGTHGDHPVIALTPYSVEETYEATVRAFNLSEQYRVPVILLLDEVIAHVNEKVALPEREALRIVERPQPEVPPEQYLPFVDTPTGVPPMAPFGTGYRYHVTGLAHDETGFQTNDPKVIDAQLGRLPRTPELGRHDIVEVDEFLLEDAEIGVFAYGSSARSARRAIRLAREKGIRAGMLRPKTMWPFPDEEVRAWTKRLRAWLVPEMNLGQAAHEVEWAVAGAAPVRKLGRVDGNLFHPNDILAAIEELA